MCYQFVFASSRYSWNFSCVSSWDREAFRDMGFSEYSIKRNLYFEKSPKFLSSSFMRIISRSRSVSRLTTWGFPEHSMKRHKCFENSPKFLLKSALYSEKNSVNIASLFSKLSWNRKAFHDKALSEYFKKRDLHFEKSLQFRLKRALYSEKSRTNVPAHLSILSWEREAILGVFPKKKAT